MSRNNSNETEVPDPKVAPMAERRRFSAETKLRIMKEAEHILKEWGIERLSCEFPTQD